MKKLIFMLLFLALLPYIGKCAPRSLEQMKKAATAAMSSTQVGRKAAHGKADGEIKLLREDGQLAIFGYDAGGFAVIAKDNAFNAVLGYSDTGWTDNVPPALIWWIETMDKSLDNMLAGGKAAVNIKPGDGMKGEVTPMLTTQWDQEEPYYNDCPTYTENGMTGHYVTGCVATAMAQIMNYHKYPATGKGYKSLTAPNGKKVQVAFEGTQYDWANMLDRYYAGGYNTTQADAVATLMLHCGVAVNMNYGTVNNGGSGALSSDAALGLREYFSYSTKIYEREFFPVKEWMNIIYDELSAGLPIEYGGNSSFGGHAFVFDGYDADGLVHVNWGWSGSGDGYFDIATLNGYSSGQDMIIIHPLDDPSNEIPYTSLWGLQGGLSIKENGLKSITYNATAIYNLDIENFTGTLALMAEPVDGGEKIVLDGQYASNVAYLRGYGNYGRSTDISVLPDGKYRLYLASKSERETDWQPIRSHENVTNNYVLTISGSTTLLTVGDSNWTASGIAKVEATDNADNTVRVYTPGGIMIYSSPADKFNINAVPATGLLIIKDGEKVRKTLKD